MSKRLMGPVGGQGLGTIKSIDRIIQNKLDEHDGQESVQSIVDFTAAEPAVPSLDDRYLNSGTGAGSVTGQSVTADYIYRWNGSIWEQIIPDEGTTMYVEDVDEYYSYVDTGGGLAWVLTPTLFTHNDLNGKQGGTTSEYYHLTAAQYSALGTLGSMGANLVVYTDASGYLKSEAGFGYVEGTDIMTVPNATVATNLILTAATASRLTATDGSKIVVSIDLDDWVAGTANQVTVTDDTDGSITLSTPQDIHSGASPEFVTATLSGLTASRLVATSAAKALESADLYAWVTETSNQVLIGDDGDGTITFSTPQDIHSGATPSFAGMTITQVSTTGAGMTVTRNLGSASTNTAIAVFNNQSATDDMPSLQVINSGTGPGLKIGSTGTSHSLSGNSLFVGAQSEFDGNAYFDANCVIYGVAQVVNGAQLTFGTSNNSTLLWNTSQTSALSYFGVDPTARILLIGDRDDRTYNFTHGAATNPTLIIHSANQSTTEWISMTHDQTDGVITTGAGSVKIGSTLLLANGTSINEFSTDGTMAGNSDDAVPTEKAIVTYVSSAVATKDEFIELDDTPVGYTTGNALYTTNATPDAVIETTVILTEAANTFNITKGTAILDINSATVNIDGNLTVPTASAINQDVQTTASPEFVTVTLSGLTASRLVATSATKALESADLNSWVTGTANQVSIADDGDGTITLSTPQDIHTAATPTFAGLVLPDDTASAFTIVDAGGVPLTYLTIDSTDLAPLITLGQNITVAASMSMGFALGTTITEFSTDGTMAGNSDDAVPTEKAVVSYVTSAIATKDTFLELNDTPGSYTTGTALYRINAGKTAIEETTVLITEAANNFNFAKGTGILDITAATLTVSATCTLDQNLSQASSPTFAGMTLTNAITEFSIDGTMAGNSDSAVPTEKAVVTYVAAQLATSDTFLELTDTPGAYTTGTALYRINAGKTAIEETTVLLTEAANNFNLTKGTGILDITAATLTVSTTCTLDQNLAQAASPTFAGITLTNAITEFSTDGTMADNSDSAVPTEKAIVTYVAAQIETKDTFLELTDTPGAYTTATALYRINAGKTAVEETTVTITEPAGNQFTLTAGTSALAVTTSCTIDQNLAQAASPTFAGITLTNAITEFSIDGTMADNSDSAVPTEKAVVTYVASQIETKDTFLELTDTPGAYTTDGALYVADNTGTTIQESTVIMTEAANTFAFTKGTASLDIAAGATLNVDANLTVNGVSALNQDVQTSASPAFVALGLTSNLTLDNTGTDVSSPLIYLKGDNGGNEIEGTIQLIHGAQPYLRLSVSDDGTTPVTTAIIDMHDTQINPSTPGAVALGETSSRFSTAWLTGKLTAEGADLIQTTTSGYGFSMTRNLASDDTDSSIGLIQNSNAGDDMACLTLLNAGSGASLVVDSKIIDSVSGTKYLDLQNTKFYKDATNYCDVSGTDQRALRVNTSGGIRDFVDGTNGLTTGYGRLKITNSAGNDYWMGTYGATHATYPNISELFSDTLQGWQFRNSTLICDEITLAGVRTFTLPDNTASVFNIVDNGGTPLTYMTIDSTDASPLITFGQDVKFTTRQYASDYDTLTPDDTTPPVDGGNDFKTANTAPTTISDFDDGVDTQLITIVFGDDDTTIADNANINLAGGANFLPATGDTLVLKLDGTVWNEITRSVN